MKQDDIFGGADYRINMFKGLDAWDLLIILGLVQYQPKEVIALVDSMTKDEAHARALDDDRPPKGNALGSGIGPTQKLIKPECKSAFLESTISTTSRSTSLLGICPSKLKVVRRRSVSLRPMPLSRCLPSEEEDSNSPHRPRVGCLGGSVLDTSLSGFRAGSEVLLLVGRNSRCRLVWRTTCRRNFGVIRRIRKGMAAI